ncbi:hypothetical protein F8S13_22495 [Chloroflexia bacterium SDU3-3]|nr:hypothetical protein F8S13_22495 [Chloroflexia bacterium SDU3-3]
MLIALAGKGSSGKSTLAAVLVDALAAQAGVRSLIVDADPHQSLCMLMGVQPPHTLGTLRSQYERALITGRDAALRPDEGRVAFAERLLGEEALVCGSRRDVLALGRWELAGSQCTPNRVLGYALEQLVPRYPLTLIDHEAGIEPIGRFGTALDRLLVVATPEALSLDVAGQILAHARAVGRTVRDAQLILNRVRPDDLTDETVLDALWQLERLGMPLVLTLPESPALQQCSRRRLGPQALPADEPWRRKLMAALPRLLG